MANKDPNPAINELVTYGSYQTQFEKNDFLTANMYQNIDTGISIRPPYGRDVYDHYRPNEAIPGAGGSSQESQHQIMSACKMAYESVGVLRTVIDLMSDFGVDGIKIEHVDAIPQAFYTAWSKKIGLKERSERFLNWLFKSGNVVVRRQYASMSMPKVRGAQNLNIPIRYVFYDPATIKLIGDQAATLSVKKRYGIMIPYSIVTQIKGAKSEIEKAVYNSLPPELKSGEMKGTGSSYVIPLPANEIYVAHYKKDDTEMWAKSFLYSVLNDVSYNNKIKLAKVSAMDGIINVIRLWKIGDLKLDKMPTPAQFTKLAAILQSNVGGGAMDILWGPDIELKEFYPPIDTLASLEPNINDILIGIGVPGVLLGLSDKSGSGGNPYIGLKNLIQKIEYGRECLTAWLEYEIDEIQEEMNFKKRPHIRFNYQNLNDERAYQTFLLGLLDRDVLSNTTILERIKEIPDIERARLESESKAREAGLIGPKAGPFFNPQVEDQRTHEIKKIKVQAQENSHNETLKKGQDTKKNGRPENAKDGYQRTRQPKKPGRTKGALFIEAARIYDQIDKLVNEITLADLNIKDVRELTSEQKKSVEETKNHLFPLAEPFVELTADSLVAAATEVKGPIDSYLNICQESFQEIGATRLNNEEKRIIRINAYVEAWLGV